MKIVAWPLKLMWRSYNSCFIRQKMKSSLGVLAYSIVSDERNEVICLKMYICLTELRSDRCLGLLPKSKTSHSTICAKVQSSHTAWSCPQIGSSQHLGSCKTSERIIERFTWLQIHRINTVVRITRSFSHGILIRKLQFWPWKRRFFTPCATSWSSAFMTPSTQVSDRTGWCWLYLMDPRSRRRFLIKFGRRLWTYHLTQRSSSRRLNPKWSKYHRRHNDCWNSVGWFYCIGVSSQCKRIATLLFTVAETQKISWVSLLCFVLIDHAQVILRKICHLIALLRQHVP